MSSCSLSSIGRFSPGIDPDDFTEEAKQFMETHSEETTRFNEKWDTFATETGVIFTDYVVVE